MPDVRLDRPDRQRLAAPLTQNLPQRRRFDRIAYERAGAMRLDKGEVVGSTPARSYTRRKSSA